MGKNDSLNGEGTTRKYGRNVGLLREGTARKKRKESSAKSGTIDPHGRSPAKECTTSSCGTIFREAAIDGGCIREVVVYHRRRGQADSGVGVFGERVNVFVDVRAATCLPIGTRTYVIGASYRTITSSSCSENWKCNNYAEKHIQQ